MRAYLLEEDKPIFIRLNTAEILIKQEGCVDEDFHFLQGLLEDSDIGVTLDTAELLNSQQRLPVEAIDALISLSFSFSLPNEAIHKRYIELLSTQETLTDSCKYYLEQVLVNNEQEVSLRLSAAKVLSAQNKLSLNTINSLVTLLKQGKLYSQNLLELCSLEQLKEILANEYQPSEEMHPFFKLLILHALKQTIVISFQKTPENGEIYTLYVDRIKWIDVDEEKKDTFIRNLNDVKNIMFARLQINASADTPEQPSPQPATILPLGENREIFWTPPSSEASSEVRDEQALSDRVFPPESSDELDDSFDSEDNDGAIPCLIQ